MMTTMSLQRPTCLLTSLRSFASRPRRCIQRVPYAPVYSYQRPTLETEVPRLDAAVDDELSKRPLDLDPAGYFIIKVDRSAKEIVAEYFTNIINKNGATQ